MANPQFTQPPVREVSLTVLWDPIEGLLAADVGSLLNRLRASYPNITERPAMLPWAEIRLPGLQILAGDKVLPYSWWMFDKKDNRLVRFQSDRLVFSWRHTPEGQPYPEYSAMRRELVHLLETVSDWLADTKRNFELYPKIRRTQVDYINQIDMRPIDLLSGIITNWSGRTEGSLPDRSPIVSATWYIDIDDSGPNETNVRVEWDGSEGSNLAIASVADVMPEENFDESLDRAHRRSIDVFLSITSDQLQQKWGRKQ